MFEDLTNDDDCIYRYRPLEAHLFDRIIQEVHGNIWCSGHRFSNDLFDGLRFNNKVSIHRVDMDTQSESEFDRNLLTACFSQQCDSPPMWYYYANNLNGICLAYNRHQLGGELGMMTDRANSYHHMESRGLEYIIRDVEYHPDIPHQTNDPFAKSNHWAFEQEVRIVVQTDKDDMAVGEYLKISGPTHIFVGENVDDRYLTAIQSSAPHHVPVHKVCVKDDRSGFCIRK